jgi:hypothetical protein
MNPINKFKDNKHFQFFLFAFILTVFYIFLYKILIPKILAFGCFDDCHVLASGFFITRGRTLYSEIFFNHQPLIVFASAAIQKLFNPINIYDLILKHRLSLFLFSFLMNILIIWRFGKIMILFAFLFETAKYYVFGDRFLPEAFTVYPLVFLVLTILEIGKSGKTTLPEAVLTGFFVWFVFWMREPLAPAALFILIIYTIAARKTVQRRLAPAIFLGLSLILFAFFPFSSWYDTVITDNAASQLRYEVSQKNLAGPGIVISFAYPLFALFHNPLKHPYTVTVWLVSLSLVISAFCLKLLTRKAANFQIFYIFALLGLVNIRFQPPTVIFYEAFQMINWFGLAVAFSIYLLNNIPNIRIKYTILGLVIFSILINFFSPKSHIWEKPDRQSMLLTNYGDLMKYGSLVRNLSLPSNTLFVDGAEELIYWEAKRDSPYRFSMYTSIMPRFTKYQTARLAMFSENPPDFYIGSCQKINGALRDLPPNTATSYTRVLENHQPTCLLIRNHIIGTITDKFGSSLPGFSLATGSAGQRETD